MVDGNESQQTPEAPESNVITRRDSDESHEEMGALREMRNMLSFLEIENDRLKKQVDIVTAELEGLNISISAAKKDLSAYSIKKVEATGNISVLRSEKERLVTEINRLHLQNKTINKETELSTHLMDNLADELGHLTSERKVAVKRLTDIQSGLHRLSADKDIKVPKLKEYDSVLRQIYRAFKETQNRIEVSMLLRQK